MSTQVLSPFQKEKLQYYFNFFDSDGNGILELKDLEGFMTKVLEFTGWQADSAKAKECYEVHECFFSTLTEKTRKQGKETVTLEHWWDMWNTMMRGCTAMYQFPIWLRLLPKSLFRIIDSKHDGRIDEKELGNFYIKFVGIPEDNVTSLTQYAMDQMTDHGKYPLHFDSYNQIFANFLLGRTPYGPGRFIFGCFEHVVERTQFTLIQGPPENLPVPRSDYYTGTMTPLTPVTPTQLIKPKFLRG